MNLNTESIVNDVTKVVQNGLKEILSEFETKYKLYEESHNCVVKMAECMSKQVKQDGTSASASVTNVSLDTNNYVSRAEFNALAKQNQELMKHIAYEFDSRSKQNQQLMKELATMKQDMATLLSRDLVNISNESDEETKANITLKIEEIKKETIDNLIGGALDDKVNVVAGDKQEEEEEEEEESEEEEEEESEEEEEESEDEQEKPVVTTEKHVQVSTTSVSTSSEVEEEVEVEVEEEEEEESDDSDEEKEQLDEDEQVTEDADGEEEELYEIVFNSTTYCTDDDVKGSLYLLTSDGDVGDKVGHLVNGKPIFY